MAEALSVNFPFSENRAWVSAHAKGQLRLLWKRLEVEAELITKAVNSIPRAMAEAAVKQGVGATAAMDRICRRLPIEPMSRARYRAVWRFLAPVQEPEPEPPAIQVKAVLLGAPNRPPISVEPFGLTVSHHALGRMIDQRPKADLKATILEAHDCLAALPVTIGEQVFGLSNVVLPAGPGAFLLSPPVRQREAEPMFFARTWVHHDLFTPRQTEDFVSWGKLLNVAVPP